MGMIIGLIGCGLMNDLLIIIRDQEQETNGWAECANNKWVKWMIGIRRLVGLSNKYTSTKLGVECDVDKRLADAYALGTVQTTNICEWGGDVLINTITSLVGIRIGGNKIMCSTLILILWIYRSRNSMRGLYSMFARIVVVWTTRLGIGMINEWMKCTPVGTNA